MTTQSPGQTGTGQSGGDSGGMGGGNLGTMPQGSGATGDQQGGGSGGNAALAALPSIDSFHTTPSDQFLVDFDAMNGGHPFLGKRSVSPHSGGHVHFEGMAAEWPKGGTAPTNYPPIYAVADGVVTHIDQSFSNGQFDRYGIYLAIARANDGSDAVWNFEYSIEPMAAEPSPGFYATFITVTEGQVVHKGDVIAYMYTPPEANGTHIHFELMNSATQAFAAAAIFTPDVLTQFMAHWGGFGYEGSSPTSQGTPIGECEGWMLDADENPYGTGPIDCLNP